METPPPAPSETPPGERPRARPDYLGMGLLAAVALVFLLIWWVFPWLHRIVSYGDCIGSGRITGC